MRITDRKALSIFNKLKCPELRESIETFPEEEREGKSDLEIIADEIDYFKELFEDGTIFSEALEEARECLRNTENGKIMPLKVDFDNNGNMHIKYKYQKSDVDNAKGIVAQYRQICYYADKKVGRRGA